MGGFDLLFAWIIIVALVALGNRKSSGGSYYKVEATDGEVAAKEKELNKMLERIELPKGKRLVCAMFCRADHIFLVEFAYKEKGKKCCKYLTAKTLSDMERQIRTFCV